MFRKLIYGFMVSVILSLITWSAMAQDDVTYTRASEGVLLPSPSITETRDATALSVNPANHAARCNCGY